MGDLVSGSRGVVALGVALVAGALVLSGCNGGATPGDSGSPSVVETAKSASPSVTPSATPTPTAAAYKPATPEGPAENVPVPEMPAAAKENTPEGREAFIKYYFDLMNYTIEARDPSVMLRYTAVGSDYLDNLLGIYRDQGADDVWTVGGKVKLDSVDLSPSSDPYGRFTDVVVWGKEPYKYYDASGVTFEEPGGSGRQWTIVLAFQDRGWVVQGFEGEF